MHGGVLGVHVHTSEAHAAQQPLGQLVRRVALQHDAHVHHQALCGTLPIRMRQQQAWPGWCWRLELELDLKLALAPGLADPSGTSSTMQTHVVSGGLG